MSNFASRDVNESTHFCPIGRFTARQSWEDIASKMKSGVTAD